MIGAFSGPLTGFRALGKRLLVFGQSRSGVEKAI